MKSDDLLFKLFVLAYYGFDNCDEYMYNYFNRKKYRLAQAMFSSFPLYEYCANFDHYWINYNVICEKQFLAKENK